MPKPIPIQELKTFIEKEPDGKKALIQVFANKFPQAEIKEIEEITDLINKIIAKNLHKNFIPSFLYKKDGKILINAYTVETLDNLKKNLKSEVQEKELTTEKFDELNEIEKDGKKVLIKVLEHKFPDAFKKDVEDIANMINKINALCFMNGHKPGFLVTDELGRLKLKVYSVKKAKDSLALTFQELKGN